MRMFPTIGEYNQTIQANGTNAFQTLSNLSFIAARTVPIKVFLFGSGSYAVVFKANQNGKHYAIRCFLTAEQETINRYRAICDHLKTINATWKTDCQFLENEIRIKGNLYPILKMEWVEGVLINDFITNNVENHSTLTEIQKQLVETSDSLELNNVGHGDLQCGNIIVQGTPGAFKIRLIDYDGMFVPSLTSRNSVEKGRSEFQHPARLPNHFSYDIDRFSFWVMLTALEAIKFDKSLWKQIMSGGYNTLDNFLFTTNDYGNTNDSKLFKRLSQINSASLNFYTEKLKWFCNHHVSQIDKPLLYRQGGSSFIPSEHLRYLPQSNHFEQPSVSTNGKITILSNKEGATVLTATFQKLGITPLQLEKNSYEGKALLISDGKETKRIVVTPNDSIIEVKFTV